MGGEEETGRGKRTPGSRTAGKCVEQPLQRELGGEATEDISSGPREDDVGQSSETRLHDPASSTAQGRNPRPGTVPSRLNSRDFEGQISVP